jgi:Zn-finger nucleic acid-binding protein
MVKVLIERHRCLVCHPLIVPRSVRCVKLESPQQAGEGFMSEYEKPSKNEDEYFARQELERRKKWAQEQASQMAVEHREQLKQLHWMKCPKCGMDLKEIELHGVKVDQCANCGGVFMEAGEMEQIENHEHGGVMARVFSMFR